MLTRSFISFLPHSTKPLSKGNQSSVIMTERHQHHHPLMPTKYDNLGIHTSRPKRPEYAHVKNRLDSYENFPSYCPLTPVSLACAGYFATGEGDCARCFYCGGGLRNWENGDNEWVEHARWFPKCAFIQITMGQIFVDAVANIVSQSPDAQIITLDMVEESIINQHGVACDYFKKKAAARLARDRVNLTDGLINVVDESYAHRTLVYPATYTNSIFRNRRVRDVVKDLNAHKRAVMCKICFAREVSILYMPCGHIVSCGRCHLSLSTRECSVCRDNIKGIVACHLGPDDDTSNNLPV